jgi:MoaA/NifB/PqqE/SkfB family radical SAM enzyme
MDIWHKLEAEQLYPTSDLRLARDLFKRSIHRVEIEVFSYCNRRCWFCPNSVIDRISENRIMPPALYSTIIRQLADVEFSGMISYSRYNEPLSDRLILDRIAEARRELPNAFLHTNTNGDYLDRPYLDALYEAGLRGLNIQAYLKGDERYDDDKIRSRVDQTLRKLDLPARKTIDSSGEWLEYVLDYRDMNIRLYGRNFGKNGTDRGGAVDVRTDYLRSSPCLMPFFTVYIDYNGRMVPCCNIRSDHPAHAGLVSNDLNAQPNIVLAYANDAASQFRMSLMNEEPKPGACAHCAFAIEEMNAERRTLMTSAVREAESQLHRLRPGSYAKQASWLQRLFKRGGE